MSEPCPRGWQNETFFGDRVIAALIRKDELTLEWRGPPILYNWDPSRRGNLDPEVDTHEENASWM